MEQLELVKDSCWIEVFCECRSLCKGVCRFRGISNWENRAEDVSQRQPSDRLGSGKMQEIQDGKSPTSCCFARHNSLFEIPNTL